LTQGADTSEAARAATQQNKLRLPYTRWWEKRLQAVFMACFLQPECVPRHSHRGQAMEGKWAILYLIVVVVLTLSYSADLRIIKLPSVALPVMHLRTVAD
jgi:hypothetical protein